MIMKLEINPLFSAETGTVWLNRYNATMSWYDIMRSRSFHTSYNVTIILILTYEGLYLYS